MHMAAYMVRSCSWRVCDGGGEKWVKDQTSSAGRRMHTIRQ